MSAIISCIFNQMMKNKQTIFWGNVFLGKGICWVSESHEGKVNHISMPARPYDAYETSTYIV